ncbi:hypothetical protein NEOLEDRAFT_609434 [Neolentinus lepideus HHB14362 ss-1]|uniref:Uncharacterized protein n=1 Tax=Neolentinus lepideus HHB14362 ss-1 TaxID=1314782 RepID=A0A165VEC1_9AGAM|nr:hypothetical protein NEOLEDRAFT_609434 [Neolentinus lepideus HHB14362 ss-1]
MQRGEGDDQYLPRVDGALLPWLDALTNDLAEHFPCTPPSDNDILPPQRVTLIPTPSPGPRPPPNPASPTCITTGPPSTATGTPRHPTGGRSCATSSSTLPRTCSVLVGFFVSSGASLYHIIKTLVV